ncbi:MAG: hypothetical protein QOI69_2931, partial [Pseudonocardiales bacterium]|nr:hypothetical protein [Pseudonocardiales bacterium]
SKQKYRTSFLKSAINCPDLLTDSPAR